MLYVGIDQHRKQLTVSVREESGSVVLRRQVSTAWQRVGEFFDDLRDRACEHGGYLCVVEVCGFNQWLLKFLAEKRGGHPPYGPTADVLPGRLARDTTPKAVAMSSGSLGNG